MQLFDLLQCCGQIAVVVYYIVRDPEPLVTGGLRGKNTTCLALRFGVTGHQAPYLGTFLAIDHQNPIDELSDGRLCQQWYHDNLVAASRAAGALRLIAIFWNLAKISSG